MALYPARLAVQTRQRRLTYAALNGLANRVARTILARRGEAEEAVALLLDLDDIVPAALFGALKAGKFWVALDRADPPPRIRHILDDSQASLLLTCTKHMDLASSLVAHREQIVNLDALDERAADTNLDRPGSPDAVAQLLYTSGSTGEPKGVVHNHRNMLHQAMYSTNTRRISADDRLVLFATYSHLGAPTATFRALLNGAALFPFDVREDGVAHLAPWLSREGITLYFSVPTVFRQLVATLHGGERFSAVRLVDLAGERVTRRDVESVRRYFPAHCVMINNFGSTEGLSYRQYRLTPETPLAGSTVPIGYAVADTEAFLIDESGAPVEPGGSGEIVIKSRYLALGYWRQPALTQSTFLPDPTGGPERLFRTGDVGRLRADGCMIHLGRTDSQVKIHGHRVDIFEIEAALLDCPGVRHAVVIAREDRRGDLRLVAYVVRSQSEPTAAHDVQEHLRQRLPLHLVPAVFIVLDALPVLPHGKVNYAALPLPDEGRPGHLGAVAAPRTPLETALLGIWTQVLRLDQVGIHDNFLALGGDSLKAIQVIARVLARLSVDLPVRALFETPTIAEMAIAITHHMAEHISPETLAAILSTLGERSEADGRQRSVEGIVLSG